MRPGLPLLELHRLPGRLFRDHQGKDSFDLVSDGLANVQTDDWHDWENYWTIVSIAFATSWMQQCLAPATDLDAISCSSPSVPRFRSHHHPLHPVARPSHLPLRVPHHARLRDHPRTLGLDGYPPLVGHQIRRRHRRVGQTHLRSAHRIHAILPVSIAAECVLSYELEPKRLCVNLVLHLLLAIIA